MIFFKNEFIWSTGLKCLIRNIEKIFKVELAKSLEMAFEIQKLGFCFIFKTL